MQARQEMRQAPRSIIGIGFALVLAVLVAAVLGYVIASTRSTSPAVSAPEVTKSLPLTQAPDAVERNQANAPALPLAQTPDAIDRNAATADPGCGDLACTMEQLDGEAAARAAAADRASAERSGHGILP